jgi:hypothetical protein
VQIRMPYFFIIYIIITLMELINTEYILVEFII